MKDIFILLGCEESQVVCIEFRKLGFQAFSCDTKPCSGGHPEWHLQMDVFKAIAGGMLVTQSGELININKWHCGIFFPTCTYLTRSANIWFKDQTPLKSGALVGNERVKAREQALQFVCDLMNCNIDCIAIENPAGVIVSRIFWHTLDKMHGRWEVSPTETNGRKSDQIIQPYYFGDEARKTTCLWLKNLPKLFHTKTQTLFDDNTHVSQGESLEWKSKKTGKLKRQPKWYAMAKQGKDLGIRSEQRSKTFNGIATQMAVQWSEYLTMKIR